MNKLSGLLILALVSTIYAAPFSSPCSKEEMEEPIQNFYKIIEALQSKEVNAQPIIFQLADDLDEVPAHLEKVKTTCGDEKEESIIKLNKFIENIQKVKDIAQALSEHQFNQAKELIETFHCPHLVQFTVRLSNAGRVVELLQVLENMKTINLVNEALIYVIDESNMNLSSTIIPLMKKQILENKDKVPEDVLLTAKLNMKEMVKITSIDCNKGFLALNKVDNEMADQAFYEVMFQNVTETNVQFKKLSLAPNLHFKVIGIEAFYDKLLVLEMQHSIYMAKVLTYAKLAKADPGLLDDSKAEKILENILANAPEFAKKVSESYLCQDFEQMKSIVTDQEAEQTEHNEYTVFYNSAKQGDFDGKYIENPDGELMMITVQRTYGSKTYRFSVVVENGNYPENLHMSGKIISKKVLSKESAEFSEICRMDPRPVVQICAKFQNALTRENHAQARRSLYEKFEQHIEKCNE